MSIDFLISILNSMENPKRVNRNNAAIIVLEQPELIKHLVILTFDVTNKLSIKAAWILEWISTHHGVDYILPYINEFTQNLHKLQLDSALRPCAKICEQLATAYTSKKQTNTQDILTEVHIDLIVESGFDWLITQQKIAVKAYTMSTLYLFGLEREWIHPELAHIIRTKVIHESKGCEARGRKILALITKNSIAE